jgi:hypothetical protein
MTRLGVADALTEWQAALTQARELAAAAAKPSP